jgi:hypothetical protein
MINDNSTGYWDYSNEIAPQWMDYGSPGAAPKTGSMTVGGGGNAAPVGAGGAPIGGANPIFSVGPPNPNTNTNPNPSQFTPNPFMTPGMTFQPHTQFGQQASAPLNLSQHGQTYGQMPGGPNTALRAGENPAGPQYLTFSSNGTTYMPQQLRNGNTMYQPSGQPPMQDPREFNPVRFGGPSGSMPQFQNPYGPQPQAQPQQYRQMGQQPTQISQQPQQPDAAGIAALMRSAMGAT